VSKLAYMFNKIHEVSNMEAKSHSKTRMIRWPEVHDRVGYCRTNIYYLIQSGDFPAPIKLGSRAVGWLESDIEDWINSRIKNSRYGGEI
jgi:prophage regulatory protein